jgi:hypothetical protein
MLESLLDGQSYLQHAISPEHFRELRRQWRRLDQLGALSYNVARQPADIRLRMEEFLLLEAAGWKGRGRTAMINDRYRAAFAREAISNLAETDGVRIHTLDLDGRAIASMVVFLTGGEAYTWKTAYDEEFAKYSPGKLLVAELTEWHLDDANIARSDSCAVSGRSARTWERSSSACSRTATATCGRWRPSFTSTATPATWRGCCARRSGRLQGVKPQKTFPAPRACAADGG